jgi:hypothetical protein
MLGRDDWDAMTRNHDALANRDIYMTTVQEELEELSDYLYLKKRTLSARAKATQSATPG